MLIKPQDVNVKILALFFLGKMDAYLCDYNWIVFTTASNSLMTKSGFVTAVVHFFTTASGTGSWVVHRTKVQLAVKHDYVYDNNYTCLEAF